MENVIGKIWLGKILGGKIDIGEQKPYLITLALNGQGSVVHPFLLIIQSVQDSGQSFPHLLANSPNLVPSNLPAAT